MRILKRLGLGGEMAVTPGTQTGFSSAQVVDEHFVPGAGLDLDAYIQAGDLTAVHHLVRYLWARQVISGLIGVQSVLDLGCGSGYGTFLLAQSAPGVQFLGVDYDAGAVAAATESYSLDNLSYCVGDPADWDASIGERSYQVMTCFDVLEHVLHRDLVLEGVVRHLEPEGSLLFSTPCGSAENILEPGWEHHRIEFAAASLYDLLRRYFGAVLRPEEEGWPAREVFDQLHARGVDYLLRLNPVVCRQPIRISNPYRT